MRSLAICGSRIRDRYPTNTSFTTFELSGVPVTAGIIETGDTRFDPADPANARRVLLRVRAFSCNYRDKSLVLKMATNGPSTGFYVIGSEFVAEVEAVGPEVRDLHPGDRVIPDGAYPGGGASDVPGGLPTNHGSRERLVLHRDQLLKIPEAMSDEVAAAFPIGGQTSYSMLRKLRLRPGEDVLVTAGRSNTSLFTIQALRHEGVTVRATSTAPDAEAALLPLGVEEVIPVGPAAAGPGATRTVSAVADEIGGFDAVVDPFFDLHLVPAVQVMDHGGRYVTCGLHDQHAALSRNGDAPESTSGIDLRTVMAPVLVGNLEILGNCLGTTRDLARAVRDHADGRLDVIVDSVHSGLDAGAFLERTFCDRERLGKVVFRYD